MGFSDLLLCDPLFPLWPNVSHWDAFFHTVSYFSHCDPFYEMSYAEKRVPLLKTGQTV